MTLADGWAELLARFRWDWFLTLTFRDHIHPEAADKRFRYFASKLNRTLFGPRWHTKPSTAIYWCRGLELQRRGVVHFHALMGCRAKELNHHALRQYWANAWRDMAGFARIERVRSASDAASYLTKYVSKGGEIDLSANLASQDDQRPLW